MMEASAYFHLKNLSWDASLGTIPYEGEIKWGMETIWSAMSEELPPALSSRPVSSPHHTHWPANLCIIQWGTRLR